MTAAKPARGPDRGPTLFFGLAFAISWTCWSVTILSRDSLLGIAGYYAGGFGPLLAALIATKLTGGDPVAWFRSLWRWRVAGHFWLFAFGFPVLLALLASGLFGLSGGPVTLSDLPQRLLLWLPTLLTVTLFIGGNEEPGWRGFALPALQKRWHPALATLCLGCFWAIWHIPLIGVREGGLANFVMTAPEWLAVGLTFVSITAHAFWYTWIINRTGSVLLCMVLHGGYNAANARFILVPADAVEAAASGNLLWIMTALIVGSVVMLLLSTYGRLGRA